MKFLKEIANRQQNKLLSVRVLFKQTIRILDDLKKKVGELKIDDKKLFEKNKNNDLDKLFKSIVDELSDFSLLVKESDFKIENFIKKISSSVKSNQSLQANFVSTPTSVSKNYFPNKSNEGSDINNVVKDLRNKNEELVSEMMELKEKFVEAKIKNIDLKNKLKGKADKDDVNLNNKLSKLRLNSKTELRMSKKNTLLEKEIYHENDKNFDDNSSYSKPILNDNNNNIIKTYFEKVK